MTATDDARRRLVQTFGQACGGKNMEQHPSEIAWVIADCPLDLIEELRIERARAAAPTMQCPDGGTCHHHCGIPAFHGRCFRVESCGPLSGVYPNDDWPVPAPNPKEIT